MKFDLHNHTLKIKDSERKYRNVGIQDGGRTIKQYFDQLINHGIGIVAITNHNWFDLKQFNELENYCKKEKLDILFLPGIEIDIKSSDEDDNKIYNLNIIVGSDKKDDFAEKIQELIGNEKKAKKYSVEVDELIKKFEQFEKIFLLPNKQKGGKELSKDNLKKLQDNCQFWFFETTNPKSAKIYAYKGNRGINGSDVYDESDIDQKYNNLPEIRIKIDTFGNLLKFFNKDPDNWQLVGRDKKLWDLDIQPEGFKEKIEIPIYKDVTTIIGARGSGKTVIFNAIAEKIKIECKKNFVIYKQNDKNMFDNIKNKIINEINDMPESFNFEKEEKIFKNNINNTKNYNFENVVNNFNKIKNYYQRTPGKYKNWSELQPTAVSTEWSTKLNTLSSDVKSIDRVRELIKKYNQSFNLEKMYVEKILNILVLLKEKLYSEFKSDFNNSKTVDLVQKLLINTKKVIDEMTGSLSLPEELGLYKEFSSRTNLKKAFEKVLETENYPSKSKLLGAISATEDLYIHREWTVNPYSQSKEAKNYESIKSNKLSIYKELFKKLEKLKKNVYNETLQAEMTKLLNWADEKNSKDWDWYLKENFVWWRNCITVGEYGAKITPSDGQKEMLKLTHYLNLEQDFYFLDEPELSLDNHFISMKIVDKLNALARASKTIIVVTHNANIGVLTAPWLTIYRKSKPESEIENYTYLGSCFLKKMKNTVKNTVKDELFWRKVCQEILEGGEYVFNERYNLYKY